MRRLALLAASVALAACAPTPAPEPAPIHTAHGDPAREARPFPHDADAMADVDAALARAETSGRRAIVVLGSNTCHDSRGLAWRLDESDLAPLIAESYEVVYVDVGRRDSNLDVARRFGVSRLQGTPTVFILDPDGTVLNADSVHDWTTAASRSLAETQAYFSRWARAE